MRAGEERRRVKEAGKNPLEMEEHRTQHPTNPLNPAGKGREKDSIIPTNCETIKGSLYRKEQSQHKRRKFFSERRVSGSTAGRYCDKLKL